MEDRERSSKPQAGPIPYQIYMCGPFLVKAWDGTSYQPVSVGAWGGSHYPRLLFKLLVCSPGRQASRGHLLDILWPTIDPEEAARYLNDAAYRLRKVFTQDGESLFLTAKDSSSYVLAGQDQLWVDADAALSLLEQAEAKARQGESALPLLEAATDLLSRGEFLPEEEHLTFYGRRARIGRARRGCLLDLAKAYGQQGWLRRGEALLNTLLEENALDEDALCALMLNLHQQGRTSEGLRLYEETRTLIEREGLTPTEMARTTERRLRSELPSNSSGIASFSQILSQYTSFPDLSPDDLPEHPTTYTTAALQFPSGTSFLSLLDSIKDLLSGLSPALTLNILETFRLSHQERKRGAPSSETLYDIHLLGIELAQAAYSLRPIFEEGWEIATVEGSLRMLLPVIASMPARSTLMPQETCLSSEAQGRLCRSLGKSIEAAWKWFHITPIPHIRVIGEALLFLIQQNHRELYPQIRPLFYSAVYQLLGAAHYFLAEYETAQRSLKQAYLTGLQGANPWNMAQSLSWQAYVYKALGNPQEALETVDEALRLISPRADRESLRLRARLFALGAESAAILGDAAEVEYRLQASQRLLESLPSLHEEFDEASWLQQSGMCALQLGNYPAATASLEQALALLPASWFLRYSATAIPLGKSLILESKADQAFAIARKTLPIVASTRSPLLAEQFMTSLHADLGATFPTDERYESLFLEAQQQLESTSEKRSLL